ncbi:type II toxin-antitoxin system prevent-host-death family antitoxin [Xylanimonas oleitrophica]|uniref:Antitoxin n=1 Tax=Xylanimonas oleitrophica TaxID=2607479 RepID=A0A2W5WKR9_9MICO|nr:type II toxin-antitoxin system prevent-host-death family antitoxin [Xylanimonas oleitrophica]PZR51652.1 type II toxin-antitoxin system prevent-host-death family antitoxin [Xylanimonas oleitrophica]
MEVAVSALRAELKSWIERARAGEEVVITDRGLPVARLSGIDAADLVQGLVRDGLLTPAQVERPAHTAPQAPSGEVPVAAGRASRGAAAVSGLVRRIRR